jgi:hypothetical protein
MAQRFRINPNTPTARPGHSGRFRIEFSNPRAVDASAGERVRNGPVPDHEMAQNAPSAHAPGITREQDKIAPLTLRLGEPNG